MVNDDLKKLAKQASELSLEIKQKSAELEIIKSIINDKMIENKLNTISGNNFKIRHTFYKNDYAATLHKEFSNLSFNIISDLIKLNIVTVIYKLNSSEYQKLVEKKLTSPVDPFVYKRRSKSFIAIRTKENN
jgi:putative exporter of polyketide antibiotics